MQSVKNTTWDAGRGWVVDGGGGEDGGGCRGGGGGGGLGMGLGIGGIMLIVQTAS